MHIAREPRRAVAAVLHGLLLLALVLATCAACAGADEETRVATAAPATESPAAVAAPAHAPPAQATTGMVRIPGGEVHIGAEDGAEDERPVFAAQVRPFLLDRHPVTVAQFRRFVAATGHVTEAERFGDAGVMDPATGAWTLVPGAAWHHPLGPAGPAAPDDHPVTQVSWNDAAAYAHWMGRRLPTEIEWEHAARGATNSRAPYPWGDRLVEGRRHRANTGEVAGTRDTSLMDDRRARPPRTHQHPSDEDGFLLTSPVGEFGETSLGLTDMGGNVWEWTASWYRPYADRDRPYTPSPLSERVQRGGSFLCSTDFCHGFRVSARSHATPETALFHVGFRTAADVPNTSQRVQ